jgi:hypothetical protein
MLPLILSYALLAPGQPPIEAPESLGYGVVLLDSGMLYEGRVDRVGNLYRVMTGGRAEMFAAANVAFQGVTKDEAYEFLKGKKKANVAEDAARLADWCLRYGLAKKAADEARLAARIKPDDKALAKLVADCEKAAAKDKPVIRVVGTPPSKSAATAPPVSVPTFTPVAATAPVPVKTVELESSFAKSVQPVLMNLCVNCHADPARAGGFVLTRIPEGVTLDARTAENLGRTLAFVSKEHPATSPLVVRALTPHGGRSSPLLTRGGMAHKNLELWATAAAATMPAAPAKSVVTVSESTVPVSPAPSAVAEPKPLPPLPAVPVPPTPKAVDPFDPAEFNQSYPKKR